MGIFDSIGSFGQDAASRAAVELGLDASPLKRDLGKVGPEMEKAATGWGKAFKLASVGLGAFAVGFMGFVADGIKKADELDAAIARIGAQTGMTAAGMAKLRSGLLDISTRVPHGIDELAKSIEQVARAGYNVDDSLRIQEAAARAATVTHADLAGVTGTVVTAMKAWNIAGKDVNKVTDTLLTTVGRSRMDWDSLSRIIATAAPIAKDAGIGFNDLNAAIIAVGRSGLPARRAASGVITLIRSLSSPAAQKQMAALGLTVNKTTIEHDGLLKTLEKIQAAAGRHISVIVRTKASHVDLTKATETLRVAELRLSELQHKRHVAGSTMLSAENRVADARRRLAALQAKAASSNIDYAKSVDATKKANVGALEEMKAMVGGASGLITADILLGNGARDFKEGQDALNKSVGQTAAEFRAVMEADLGAQIALIRNKVTELAIELGSMLLPSVAKFISWLSDSLPKALRGIGDLWNTYLKAPVTAMVGSFLGFADALRRVLFDWGSGSSGANGIKGFFNALAAIMGTLATDLGTAFDVLTNFLNIPGIGILAKLIEGLIAFRLLVTGIPALVRGLLGSTGGVFSKLTGIGGGAVANTEAAAKSAGASAALDRSAAELGSAAGELGDAAGELGTVSGEFDQVIEAQNNAAEATLKAAEATTKGAEALMEAATTQREASLAQKEGGLASAVGGESGVNAAELIRNQTYVESTIAANESTIKANAASEHADASTVTADDATLKAMDSSVVASTASKEASSASMAASRAATEAALAQKEGVVAQKEGALGGLGAGLGFGALLGSTKNLLGKGIGLIGGLISKAIVPLLIAQIASDILKEPVGDFVASQFGLKNVGAKIKEDFLGGAIDWFKTVVMAGGSEAWVGKAEDTTVGKATFKTINLAKLGIDEATIDQLQAPEGTIAHAQGEFKAIPALTDDLARHAGEDIIAWYQRIRDQLPDDVSKQAVALFADLHSRDKGTNSKAVADLTKLLSDQTASQLGVLSGQAQDDYLKALEPALKAQGFTAGQIRSLKLPELANIGNIMLHDTTGKYKAVVDFLMHSYLGEFAKNTDSQVQLLSAETQGQISTLRTAFGDNWQAVLRKFAASSGKGTFKVGGKNFIATTVAKQLSTLFGPEWQADVSRLIHIKPPAKTGKVGGMYGTVADSAKLLEADATTARHAIEDFYKTVPQNIQDALNEFIASEPTRLPAATLKELSNRFGDDWLTAFKDGTSGIGDGKLVPGVADKLKHALGASWSAVMAKVAPDKANLGLDAGTVAKLKSEFGKGWEDVVKAAAKGTVDKDIAAKMEAAFGPHWREALQTFGTLLFQKEGGADTLALRTALKTAIGKAISGMDLGDIGAKSTLTTDQRKRLSRVGEAGDLTPAQEAKSKAAIQKVINSIPDATLLAMGSSDMTAARKAMTDVGTALEKAIPDPQARNRLIGTLADLSHKAQIDLPTAAQNATAALGPLGTAINTLSGAFSNMNGVLDQLAKNPLVAAFVGGGGGGGSASAPQGNRRGTQRGAAGLNFSTAGETTITAGEAGPEQVVVVSGPKRISLRQLFAMPDNPGRAALNGLAMPTASAPRVRNEPDSGGPKRSLQQLFVDHMHIQSRPDEQSILETLEFMAPGGIG